MALTLYYVSDEGRLKKTANTFGLSRACVSLIRRITRAITVHLGPNYVKLPITENAVKDCVTNLLLGARARNLHTPLLRCTRQLNQY